MANEVCNKCGAVIDSTKGSKHRTFHRNLDDLETRLRNVEAMARRAGR